MEQKLSRKCIPAEMKHIDKIYNYCDETGTLIFQVIRRRLKNFSQRRPVDEKRFAWGLSAGWYEARTPEGDYYLIKGAPVDPNQPPSDIAVWLDKSKSILYNLQSVLQTINKGEPVFVAEGEKDADCLSGMGCPATTNPMGAGKWRQAHTESLKGCKEVVIIADKDKSGRAHAEDVASQLVGISVPIIRVIEMPDRNGAGVKDFTDWFNSGGTKEEFEQIVANAPTWQSQGKGNGIAKELVDRYGMPYYTNRHGEVISINESFWAGRHYAENIELHEPVEKAFYRYDSKTGLYVEVSENIIKKEIANTLLQASRDISLPSLECQRKNSVLNHVVAHLKGIGEKRGAFIKNQCFVHLENVVIVFKSMGEKDITGFSPSFYSRNQSPIHYDPKARCDRFLEELLYPAVHKEDALLIQKYTGLCLLGNNLIQRFLILDGMPGRGKSTLSLIIQKLVGLNNVTELRTRHLAERFELFRYLKKTLLIGVDVPGRFLSQRGASVIKGLVGGDNFDAEQKCGTGSFQLQGKYCVIITSNSRLQIKLDGDLGAWRRRLLIVRFETPPPVRKIPDFANQLIRDEGSGILNWALGGLTMLIDDINQRGDIQLGDKQIAIVDALLAESDSLRHFLNDRVVQDEYSDLSVHELVEAYAEYCPTKGWNPKPITIIHREIDSLMLELFHTAKTHSLERNGKAARGFHRVRLKNGDDE